MWILLGFRIVFQVDEYGLLDFESSNLHSLNVNSCMGLTKTSLSHMSRIPNLRVLDIGFTNINDNHDIKEYFTEGFKCLCRINILHSKISEEGIAWLSNMYDVGEIVPW